MIQPDDQHLRADRHQAGRVPGYVGWWSFTEMSAQDAARLGECVAGRQGRRPEVDQWVLTEMTQGRAARRPPRTSRPRTGGGRWGIIDGLPTEILAQAPVSIKNGWTR